MPNRFVAYIDESGDDGFAFPEQDGGNGSSDWFVLSAIVTPVARDKEVIELGQSIKRELRLQKSILHFSKMQHPHRVYAIDRISSSWLTTISIVINKRKIEQPEVFADAFRLYKYTARLLLERLSWHCRDAAQKNDCECRLIFEHKKHLSSDDLRAYLVTLKGLPNHDPWLNVLLNNVTIHWPAIVPEQVEVAQKSDFVGLQLADCVASGTRAALERRHGFTEHRFAKMLKPRVYKYRNNYASYGLKFFPKGLEANDPRGHWLRKHFHI